MISPGVFALSCVSCASTTVSEVSSAHEVPAEALAARRRVGEFLATERAAARYVPHRSSWMSFDAPFSGRAGAAGFIGITWPREFGGHAQSSLVRFVVTEEMLAAGA